MKSSTTERFRKAYRDLPAQVQQQTRRAYRRFLENPSHPSLQFKRVHTSQPIYSARINRDYRALGVLSDNEIVWFWIGSHADYDKLLDQLK